MIRSFKDPEAEALFSGKFSRRLQQVARVAQRKLQQLTRLENSVTWRRFLVTGSRRSRATGGGNTAFGSTISIASASSGTTGTQTMWRSWTTTSARRK